MHYKGFAGLIEAPNSLLNSSMWIGEWKKINYIVTVSHCSRRDAWLLLFLFAQEDL